MTRLPSDSFSAQLPRTCHSTAPASTKTGPLLGAGCCRAWRRPTLCVRPASQQDDHNTFVLASLVLEPESPITAKAPVIDSQVGWQHDSVVLAGLSFGGGVAQHYALRFPSHVERLLLVASVGSPEPSWRPMPVVTRAFVAFTRWLLFPSEPTTPVRPPLCWTRHTYTASRTAAADAASGRAAPRQLRPATPLTA